VIALSILAFIYYPYFYYPYFCKCKEVKMNKIVVLELLLDVSGERHINYCKLLRNAIKNDSASIRAFTLLKFHGGESSYNHGWVIVDLIGIIGEDKFIRSLAAINDREKGGVKGYIRAGLEYGKNPRFQGKPLEEAFPKVNAFLNVDKP